MDGNYVTQDKPLPEQPGILDFGVFVTCSSSRSGSTHWIRVCVVPQSGPAMVGKPLRWTTSGMPNTLLQDVVLAVSALLEEEVEHRYGIAYELPY